MHTQNLPPLEFNLTPGDRDKAAYATVYLEDRRRRLNELELRRRNAEAARQLEAALEDLP